MLRHCFPPQPLQLSCFCIRPTEATNRQCLICYRLSDNIDWLYLKTLQWRDENSRMRNIKQRAAWREAVNFFVVSKVAKNICQGQRPNLQGGYVSRSLFQGFTTMPLSFDLGNFFSQIVVWKRVQTVWGVRRWELGNVLVSSERLLEVKGANFYLMNLAVLL